MEGVTVWSYVCCAVISVVSSFAVIALDYLFISGDCLCSVALPHGAVGWPAVRDCGNTHLLFGSVQPAQILANIELRLRWWLRPK